MKNLPSPPSALRILTLAAFLAAVAACGPNFQASANRLRAQTIAQQKQIDDLQQKLAARDAAIHGLQANADEKTPRIQTLPNDRLAELFTAGRFEIQPSTAFSDLGDGKFGLRVEVRTMTDDGMIFPATGHLTIDAVTLNPPPAQPARLGTWTFSPAQMKKQWYSGLGLNHFAFDCPVAAPLEKPRFDTIIKATFLDALTGKRLDATLTLKPKK